jgi:N-formylglutamate deformylase
MGVEVVNAGATSPIVVSLPHAGVSYPAEFTPPVNTDVCDLWHDWYTGALYAFVRDLDVQVVTTSFSPFVANPNRDPAGPSHGSFWTSLVPAQDTVGKPLYDGPLGASEIARRVELAHTRYHAALASAVERAHRRTGRALLLDLHSFGMPLGTDVILGSGRASRTAGHEAVEVVEDAFAGAGFVVTHNEPWSGGWIVKRWTEDPRVDAVQVELNQRQYLDAGDCDANVPRPRRDVTAWDRCVERLTAAVVHVLAASP